MITFIAIVHIIACLGLVTLVLIQDSKGGGVFTSQSSSNSVLGAGGATTLAQTMTKVIAAVFALTCITLSIMSAKNDKSIFDNAPVAAAPAETTPAAAPATTETAPAAATTNPAAPTEQPKK